MQSPLSLPGAYLSPLTHTPFVHISSSQHSTIEHAMKTEDDVIAAPRLVAVAIIFLLVATTTLVVAALGFQEKDGGMAEEMRKVVITEPNQINQGIGDPFSGMPGGFFPGTGGFPIPGFGNGFGPGGIIGGGYGAGFGGPNGGYSRGGVYRPVVTCNAPGPCYRKRLVCPASCFRSFSQSGKNYGAGGGGGGCAIDCKKRCIAYC